MVTTSTTDVYRDNPWRHPLRVVARAIRRWSLRDDHNATNPQTGDFETGDIPPNLKHFEAGEILPWKGVRFKVAKVCGGDFPAVILVPAGITHGTKLRTLRNYRALNRQARRPDVH